MLLGKQHPIIAVLKKIVICLPLLMVILGHFSSAYPLAAMAMHPPTARRTSK
jgi:hypothetical protein